MMKFRSHFVLIAGLVSAIALPITAVAQDTPELAVAMRVPVGRFSALSCQRLWYMGEKVLAAGRVCLKTQRARAAFSSAKRCISKNERILAAPVQTYLAKMRSVASLAWAGYRLAASSVTIVIADIRPDHTCFPMGNAMASGQAFGTGASDLKSVCIQIRA